MDYTEMEALLQELLQDPMYQKFIMVATYIAMAIVLVLYAVMYLFQGIGVRGLCRTAKIKHAGLAFVPVLRWMMLGRLAELRLPQDRRVGKRFAYSVHLPILMLFSTLLNTAYSVYYAYYVLIVPDQVPADRLAALMNGVSIAYTVIYMICTVMLLLALHRIFTLVGSGSPMLMTLLCALMTEICLPILLFVYRKNMLTVYTDTDDGNDGGSDGFYYDR